MNKIIMGLFLIAAGVAIAIFSPGFVVTLSGQLFVFILMALGFGVLIL